MDERDRLLLQILEIGLVSVRNMSCDKDVEELLKIEVEHLHNVPSYICKESGLSEYYRLDRIGYIQSVEKFDDWKFSIQGMAYPVIWDKMKNLLV